MHNLSPSAARHLFCDLGPDSTYSWLLLISLKWGTLKTLSHCAPEISPMFACQSKIKRYLKLKIWKLYKLFWTKIFCNIPSGLMNISQKVEKHKSPWMGEYGWIHKWNMVQLLNGILFSNKKWSTGTCYIMDELWKHYSQGRNSDTKPENDWFDM